MTHTIVLLSGGIDSGTCLALAVEEYDSTHPIHVNYGQQTAETEHRNARLLADHFATDPVTTLDARGMVDTFAAGTASDRDSFVTDTGDLETNDGRSTGYVPMRNLLFVAMASGIADDENADAVFLGAHTDDEASYPDCRPEFVTTAENAVNASLADGETLDLRTPLLHKTKPEILRLADDLGVPFEYTYSCYAETDADNPEPCGECPACVERSAAFIAAGIRDPITAD